MKIFLTASLFGCNTIKDSDDHLKELPILKADSLQLTRFEGGKTIRLTLDTNVPANCLIVYWPKPANENDPVPEKTSLHSCQDENIYKKMIHTEIKNLDPNIKYVFQIRSWAEDAINDVQKTKVSEDKIPTQKISGDTGYLVKTQLNKNTGFVYGLESFKRESFFNLPTGCFLTSNTETPKTLPIHLERSTLSGFSNTEIKNSDYKNFEGIFKISSKDYDKRLVANLTSNGLSKQLSFPSPKTFRSVEANALNRISVPSFREGDSPPTVRSSNGDSLNLKWNAIGGSGSSYVQVYFQDLVGQTILECRYNANQNSVNINHERILKLAKGTFYVYVELKSADIDENSNSLHLATDWRFFKIKRI